MIDFCVLLIEDESTCCLLNDFITNLNTPMAKFTFLGLVLLCPAMYINIYIYSKNWYDDGCDDRCNDGWQDGCDDGWYVNASIRMPVDVNDIIQERYDWSATLIGTAGTAILSMINK